MTEASIPAAASAGRRRLAWFAGLGALLAALIALPAFSGPYMVHIFILTLFAVVLGVSYRLLLLAGEASFCHGTFYGLGGYTVAILTAKAGWPFWIAFPLGGVVAALTAFAVGYPTLRTRGPYFFLMTFGFLIVVNALLENLKGLTGGFGGISGIPGPEGISGVNQFYYLSLVVCVVTVSVFWLFDRARWGLELRALGSSNDLAQSVGISRVGNMITAFSVGAFFAGLMGGVYASYITFVAPNSFNFWISVFILTYAVIGGIVHISGVVIGAVYISLLPVVFNWSEQFVALFVAASIVGVMLLLPHGVVGEIKMRLDRRRQQGGAHGDLATARPTESALANPDDAEPSPAAAPAGRELLVVKGLDHAFGGLHAVADIDLVVRSGETVGLIGPNGAGKTTVFNLISGFMRANAGTIIFDGESIFGIKPHEIARRGLTRTFQASTVFDKLTVFENVLAGANATHPLRLTQRSFAPHLSATEHVERAEAVLELVGLTPFRDLIAGDLPHGLKKIVGVAVALTAGPKLLCLDEPVTGMTGAEVERMIGVLRRLQADGELGILIVEHRMPVIMNVCDRVVVLNFGEIVAEGTPAEIRDDPVVHEVYLG
jgi:branched-chain amino acid transport system permease protein